MVLLKLLAVPVFKKFLKPDVMVQAYNPKHTVG
jgi:hypothetical protein